jgi:predicted metal-dependent hydrolase
VDRRTQQQILERLRSDGRRIALRFALRYRSIGAERANVKRRYGVCFSDGEIRIRLRHARTGEPLKYSSLVNTLCHELAHLRHFHHGETFKRFYLELLAFARAEGIYRPDPPGAARPAAARRPRPRARPPAAEGPEQLGLFGL